MTTVLRISYLQQAASATTNQAAPSRDEVKLQVQQTIRDAQAAALDAQAAAQDAARAGRDAAHNGRIIRVGGTGITIQPNSRDSLPPGVVSISIAFFIMCAVIAIGWPLARAFGRRLERRDTGGSVGPGVADQLQRIERAVDTMAIEIERISESQRFMAKLQSAGTERPALPVSESR